MTEATKRPWYAYGIHVQSAVIEVHELNEGYSSVCTTEGDTPEEAVANADLIVKAVNAHDALVAALVCAEADLEGLVSESEQDDHPAWQTLKEIRTALEAAK